MKLHFSSSLMSNAFRAGGRQISRLLRPTTPSLILPRPSLSPSLSFPRSASTAAETAGISAQKLPQPITSTSAKASPSSSAAALSSKLSSSTPPLIAAALRGPVPLFSDPTSTKTTGPSSLLSYPLTRVTTLSNGLRVATESGPGETATVGVWIDTGSRYEDEKTNGVAHFLEHMTFKGTSRRSRQNLELEVENLGGHLNAYTSREQTVFYAKVFKKDVGQAMDILADILQDSRVEEEDVNRERETILREMREVDGQLEEVIFDRLHATAYRGTALGRTILGSEANIESITRDDIRTYVRRHYTAPRMVIAGAGAVQHDELVKLAEKLFSSVPSEPPAGQEPYMEPARFTGSDILIRYDDMPLAHVTLGYQTAGWTDPDNFPLMLIQTMLGSWDKSVHGGMHSSSRMVSNVAKWELAHSISTFNTQYSDTGLFGVYAVAEPTTLNNLLWAISDALTTLCYTVDDVLLNEAKNQLKMNMLSHLDGSTVICEDIGRQMLTYGRRMHPVEVLTRIDAVDKNAVKQAANRFFFDRDHALAAIGPIWELPDYNWIRSRSHFARY